MEAATLAASIMPVKGQQSTGKIGAKSDSKAVKGAFANLLLALQGYAPTEPQGSPDTTTDPTDKKGKDAASNSLLQALIQLLPGQLQSSPNSTQAAEDSVDSGGSGTVPAMSVASLSLIINQAIDTLKTSGNTGQADKGLLADLTGLSQALQDNQAGADKKGAVTTAGTVDDQATASSSLVKNADGQAAEDSVDSGGSGTVPAMSVASLSLIINQAIDTLKTSGNTGQADKDLLADLAGLSQALQGSQAGAGKKGAVTTAGTVDDQATASSSLVKNADGQAADLLAAVKTALNQTDPEVLNDKGNAQGSSMSVVESAGMLPRAPDGTATTVGSNSQKPAETSANGLPSAGPGLKSSAAPTASQGATDRTPQSTTGQAKGALSQSSQDSGMTGHSKETQVKDASFMKPVSEQETQQTQESAPQSPSGSEGMNSLPAQPSLQQQDLSTATGPGQTTGSRSPTLGTGVINQIVASANLAVNNDNASMRIQLKPEWLGDLKLVVNVEQGVVNAHFIVSNQGAASLIQARLPELKQALNDQGISWQHLSVSSGAGQGSNQGAFSQSQQNLNQSQTQYDYGYPDTGSDEPPTIPVDYQWSDTGAFNYVV